jgi:hypothetical protein
MKAKLSLVLLLVVATCSLRAQDPVQFRATVVGLSVPVLVKSGGRPVRDLKPEDFQLADSGVIQDVSAIDGTALPLDLTLVVQSSVPTIGTAVSTFEEEVNAVIRSAGPSDRLRVLVAGIDPRQAIRPGPNSTRVSELTEYGCTPVYDALAVALMRRTEPNRQHVVVIVSVGEGNGSILTTDAVAAIARRSGALIFSVSVEPNVGETTFRTHVAHAVCPEPAIDWSPSRRERLKELDRIASPFTQWRETWKDSKSRLVAIAELTGGREIRPTVLTQNTTGPIREVLDEARASYILRYTPRGVPDTGWHPITVKVNRPGNYDIRVRPGYER